MPGSGASAGACAIDPVRAGAVAVANKAIGGKPRAVILAGRAPVTGTAIRAIGEVGPVIRAGAVQSVARNNRPELAMAVHGTICKEVRMKLVWGLRRQRRRAWEILLFMTKPTMNESH